MGVPALRPARMIGCTKPGWRDEPSKATRRVVSTISGLEKRCSIRST